MSCVTFQVSCALCHQFQQPQPQPQPQTIPLLTPPLCRVGWFDKTETFVLGYQHIYPPPQKKQIFLKPNIHQTRENKNSQCCHFKVTLFDQKFPVHAVTSPSRWHKQTHKHTHTQGHHILQTELAQGLIQLKGERFGIGLISYF